LKEEKMKQVLLPAELYKRIEERAGATGFKSTGDYVVFVLESVIADKEEAPLNREEEAELKGRLRALGYQD
jgi:hypothetical protein